jgi:hypothetical protein
MPVNNIKRSRKLTISGNLSLSKRIVRQTNPLSFYASSPVGEWRKKEQDYDRSNTQRGNVLVILFNIKASMHHRTLGKSTKRITPTSFAL